MHSIVKMSKKKIYINICNCSLIEGALIIQNNIALTQI